jgi:predicted ATPase/DNA-binding winged helix-turn-helix (wHTH) protein
MTRRSDTFDPDSDREARRRLDASAGGFSPPQQQEHDNTAIHPSASREQIASFGPFLLYATDRVLKRNGTPLKVGSRALDILIMLLEHAPEVVSKRDLIRQVWGPLVVDDVSLRFHVAALRKQLSAGEPSATYVRNIPGRGYCFAGAVSWGPVAPTPKKLRTTAAPLPREPLLMVGRENTVRELATLLKQQRFVSIVGAGGIGKTTMALALAYRMHAEFAGAVYFLDLGAVDDPRLVGSLLASQLGLVTTSDQPTPLILTFLRDRRALLVFDSCEHVIEAVAALTETLFRGTTQVHLLATSREALRAEGEQVHHLPPLECPPNTESLTAAQALGFPAVQLFVQQIANTGHVFELTDVDAPIVAEICRRLDGIALALELAASRVGVYGVQGTAALLDKQFRLLWRGRRTAPPRHHTLRAALDWSYNLLTPTEQLVLQRLAVFVGSFSLQAALDVVAEGITAAEATETLAMLVEKSLVTSDRTAATRYRLLDTTRAYASDILTESGEGPSVLRRHCKHMIQALRQLGATIWATPSAESIDSFVLNLGNLRAALDWSLSAEGDNWLGAELTAASACLFHNAGLSLECATWSQRAVKILDTASKDTPLELEILACSASSLIETRGSLPATYAALVRGLNIAEHLKVAPMQLYLLQLLFRWQIRSGDQRGLRELTSRIETATNRIVDPLTEAIAHSSFAVTCYLTADNHRVNNHARIALTAPPFHLSKLNLMHFGQLHGVRSVLGRNLWVLGYAEQAIAINEEAIQAVANLNGPQPLCPVLVSGVEVPFETGDWKRAEELVHRLSTIASKHHLHSYLWASLGWQGRLSVAHGDLLHGIQLLRTTIAALHEDGYEFHRPHFSLTLAEGLAKSGQRELALSTICEAVLWAETRARTLHLIDLLRAKGDILALISASEAEACLLESLELARQRGLLALELRAGISLARLWADHAHPDKALGLLNPIFNRFSEGFQTRDLVTATNLLQQLQSRN